MNEATKTERNVTTATSGTPQIAINNTAFMRNPSEAIVLKNATNVSGNTKETMPHKSSILTIFKKKLLNLFLNPSKIANESTKKTGVKMARYAIELVLLFTLYKLASAEDTRIDNTSTTIKRLLIFSINVCP